MCFTHKNAAVYKQLTFQMTYADVAITDVLMRLRDEDDRVRYEK